VARLAAIESARGSFADPAEALSRVCNLGGGPPGRGLLIRSGDIELVQVAQQP